jgi:hypothetical protein
MIDPRTIDIRIIDFRQKDGHPTLRSLAVVVGLFAALVIAGIGHESMILQWGGFLLLCFCLIFLLINFLAKRMTIVEARKYLDELERCDNADDIR